MIAMELKSGAIAASEEPGYASANINAALTTARSTAPEAKPTSAKPTEEVVVGNALSGDLATLLAVMEAFHREQMELLAQTRVDVRRLEAVFHNELGHLVLTARMLRCPEGALDAQRHIVGSRVFVPDQIPDGGARRSMSRQRHIYLCYGFRSAVKTEHIRKALTRSLPVYGCSSTETRILADSLRDILSAIMPCCTVVTACCCMR